MDVATNSPVQSAIVVVLQSSVRKSFRRNVLHTFDSGHLACMLRPSFRGNNAFLNKFMSGTVADFCDDVQCLANLCDTTEIITLNELLLSGRSGVAVVSPLEVRDRCMHVHDCVCAPVSMLRFLTCRFPCEIWCWTLKRRKARSPNEL